MRIIFLSTIIMGLFTSCHEDLFTDDKDEKVIRCEPFEDYTVPVKQGYTTYVMYGEDTLAVANEPITIKIPKNSITSRSNSELKVDFDIIKGDSTYSKYWQAVMFEDSESMDYDYNDLIIHVRNECQYPWQKDYSLQSISIQPIALGSTKTIKLGCILSDNSEHIVSDNVRRDLFNNESGFINTESQRDPIRYKLEKWLVEYKLPKNARPSIAWFIEVSGKRYYAVSSELDYRNYEMFNQQAMPYGIIAYSTFTYPEELTSIFEAYPGFKNWLEKGAANIGNPVRNLCCKYAYGNILCPDGVTRKIWDYQDLEK